MLIMYGKIFPLIFTNAWLYFSIGWYNFLAYMHKKNKYRHKHGEKINQSEARIFENILFMLSKAKQIFV